MQVLKRVVFVLLLLPVILAAGDENNLKIAVLDDCDPTDATWAGAPGGCPENNKNQASVTRAEFDAMRLEPGFYPTVVGHPSWRNEPSYLTIVEGEEVRLENQGGRPHTFTRVDHFGGGRVPPFSVGLTMAPECEAPPAGKTDPTEMASGGRLKVTGLAPGVHKFQCCFHPWMRAAIKVTESQ